MVKGDTTTLDRIEVLDCFELLSFLWSELEEEEEEASASPSHDESDGVAAPLSGKLVIT